jgi:hypothetical protein
MAVKEYTLMSSAVWNPARLVSVRAAELLLPGVARCPDVDLPSAVRFGEHHRVVILADVARPDETD